VKYPFSNAGPKPVCLICSEAPAITKPSEKVPASRCGSVCVFGGWLNWPHLAELQSGWVGLQPHLAQLESGVGGTAASPGPVRVWGGWGYSLTWSS